jgi:HK97 family phage portal protein
MSWLSRIFARRAAEEPRYPEPRGFGTGRTVAGVRIDAETMLTVPAVWACLRYLSQTVAVLPWHVMRDNRGGGEIAGTHPVDWLLWKRPNPEWSSFQLRETLIHWALRHGNGYAEIERDTVGRPIALWPIHPPRVQPARDESGALGYWVSNGTSGRAWLPAADMFHVRGFGDGPVGISVVEHAAQSIGWARAAQLFGAGFFGNGMNIGGVVELAKPLTVPGLKAFKAELARMWRGPAKAGGWPVLDNGAQFKPVAIDPEKGQFIETNQHLTEEICRWFGVPPHKIAHLLRATFSNIEHQGIEVVVDSITPWVKRFEDEADFKLFGQNRQGFYTKMNLTALLRGDTAARAAYYKAMREIGVYSSDDIRALEEMPPVGQSRGGEKLIVPANYTTLERMGEEPRPAPPPPAPPAQPGEDDPPPPPQPDAPSASIH